jgi:hypothetical protein
MQGEMDREKRRVVEQDEILGPLKMNSQPKSKVQSEVEEESMFINFLQLPERMYSLLAESLQD